MKLAEAYVEVETNQAKFSKELNTMEKSVKTSTDRMKKNFDRIGTGVSQISSAARIGFLGVTAAIAGSVYAFTKMGDTIHKMSIRTGVAATELSALGYAAQISGAELDTVERSLRYLSARMMDAETGLAEAKRAFDELDVSITDTEGNLRPTVDVLIDVADRIAVMTNETEKSALAGEIFGMRYGPMLLPLLNEGSEGITKLMDKAKELGITIDTEAAAAAAEFNDRLTDMKGVLMALGREVGEVFLPVFRNTVVIIIDKVKEWRKAIDALTPQQKKLIAQVVLLGTAALGAVGALGLFAKLAVVVKAAGLIIAGTAGLITSPLGLIMLAVGALALAWTYNWGNIQEKVEKVWKIIGPILEEIGKWCKIIWDWTLNLLGNAWKWLEKTWPTIEEGAKAFWNWLKNLTNIAWDWIIKIGGTVWDFLKDTWPVIKKGAIDFWNWLKELSNVAWEWSVIIAGTVWGFLMNTWPTIKKGAIKFWEWIKNLADKTYKWSLNILGEAWKWLKETWPKIKDTAIAFWEWLKSLGEKAIDWSIEIAGKAWDWLKDVWPKISEKAKAFWEWISKLTKRAIDWSIEISGKAWDWLKDTWPKISEAAENFWKWLKGLASKAWDWTINIAGKFWDWLVEVWPTISESAKKFWEWIKGLTSKIIGWTISMAGTFWKWIEETWPGLKGTLIAFVDWLKGLPADMKKVYEMIIKIVKPEKPKPEEEGESWAKKFWAGFTEYLEKIEKTIELKVLFIWDLVAIVGSFFKGFWEGLTKKFEEDTVHPLEIAKIIGKGLIDGIKAYIDAEFKAWIWIRDAVEEHLEEWKSIGEYIGEKIGGGIREVLKWWFKGFEIPEEFKLIEEEVKGVGEAAEETGEAIKEMIPSEVITQVKTLDKDLSHLEGVIRGQKIELETASKGWETYSQIAKRRIAAVSANFILFEHEITDLAGKVPLEFAEEFQKGFMKAKPKVQKAILDALTAGDFQRALDLAGIKIGDTILHGRSPGGIIGTLEEGQKDLSKQLDKMLGSMDAMTKKMMVIFQPIIGLFKTIFEAMLKIIEKFSPEAAAEIRALVDNIMGMMEGLFDFVEEETDELPDDLKPSLDKMKSLWQKFCDKVTEIWESIAKSIESAFVDAVTSIIAGTQSIASALNSLADTVYSTVIKAFVEWAIEAAKAGNKVALVIAGVAAAVKLVGIRIRETTTHFETAWGTIGRSMQFTNIEVGKLAEHLKESGELMYKVVGTTIEMGDAAAYVEREFAKVGLQISESLGAAKDKLEDLYQAQVDLGANTREKLINELDKYYDYRVLKEKSLDELLALSAETRVGIEAGTITEVEESEEEQEARRKDRAISRLEQIENQYKKEDELIRRKIALTEIEIKFLELKMEREAHGHSQRAKQLEKELGLMLEAYHESVEAFKEAEEGKQEAVEDTTKAVRKETKDMGKSWDDLTGDMRREMEKTFGRTGAIPIALSEAINAMMGKIGELPERIDFDVIGKLHLPDIPQIGTQYFDIFGRYTAPHIPSAQVGIPYIPRTMPFIVHKKEAILNPHQAEEWRRGGEPKTIERRTVEQNITIQSLFPPDDPVLWDRIWREGLRAAAERESGRRAG